MMVILCEECSEPSPHLTSNRDFQKHGWMITSVTLNEKKTSVSFTAICRRCFDLMPKASVQ